jgi:hypothetical protein
MPESYHEHTLPELLGKYIKLTNELIKRIENDEGWNSVKKLRNSIRKLSQFIDLKITNP